MIKLRILRSALLFVGGSIGGIAMYCIGEHEYPQEMFDDENLIKYLSISILTAMAYLICTYLTLAFVNKRLTKWNSFADYLARRFLYQTFFSAIPVIITSICIAALFVYIDFGVILSDTTYFKLDFYFVLLTTFFFQSSVYIISSFWLIISRYNKEEGYWNWHLGSDDLEDAEYKTALIAVATQRLLLVESCPNRLDEVLEKYGIVLDEIRYIYSYGKQRIIRTVHGEILDIDETIAEWAALLQFVDFMMVKRELIVSYKSVSKMIPSGKGIVSLELDPEYKYDAKLSREATRKFKVWLKRGVVA